ALLGRRRHPQPDDLAVVDRRQPEGGCDDRLLDALDLRGLPWRDTGGPAIRRRDGRHLVHRGRRAVVVDADPVEQVGGGAARADRRELAAGGGEGARHLRFDVLLYRLHVRHGHPPDETIEPTGSPRTIRLMFPARVRSKTMMGSLFSMHREMAAPSITWSPRLSTSMYVTWARRSAFLCTIGSAE